MRMFLVSLFMVLGFSLVSAGGGQASGGGQSGVSAGDGQPLGKYSPPITVRTVKQIAATFPFKPGENLDRNVWTNTTLERLGIQIKWDWSVATMEQYRQKLSVSIAAGDLSDIFTVNALELDMLVKSGLVWELDKVWDTYALPILKTDYAAAPEQTAMATYNGKLMAVPELGTLSDGDVLWVRQDWLQKLGLPEPSSIQDVLRIAEAFTVRDPDGNGKNDTAGLLLQKDLVETREGGIANFAAGYGGYPKVWINDGPENLVYGSIRPEVKAALGTLANLYKQGYINREFSSFTNTNLYEQLLSGKAGMIYGPFFYPLPFNQFENMNPGAVLNAYALPSADGKPARLLVDNPAANFYVVNKKYPHPEALVKLLNLHADICWGPDSPKYRETHWEPGEYWQLYPVYYYMRDKNLKNHLAIKEALKTGDPSRLNVEELTTWDRIQDYRNNNRADGYAWAIERIFGPEKSSYAVMDYYVQNNLIQVNGFYGTPTSTMVTRESTLKAMRDEVFTKIIMGSLPLSAFDAFVADWKRQGGDAITREVNTWYASRR